MHIWFISDTHGNHRCLDAPRVDIAVHCGDEANSKDPTFNSVESTDFFQWFGKLPIQHKIFVPGNHSTGIEKGLVDIPSNVTMLIHQSIKIGGYQFYGSPWTPTFGDGWAYMRKRQGMFPIWECIPLDTDILITHGPPKGVLDITHDTDTKKLVQVGCANLRNRVNLITPKYHAFGHIHDESGINNFGEYTRGPTTFINCSTCDIRGRFRHNGIIKELPAK